MPPAANATVDYLLSEMASGRRLVRFPSTALIRHKNHEEGSLTGRKALRLWNETKVQFKRVRIYYYLSRFASAHAVSTAFSVAVQVRYHLETPVGIRIPISTGNPYSRCDILGGSWRYEVKLDAGISGDPRVEGGCRECEK